VTEGGGLPPPHTPPPQIDHAESEYAVIFTKFLALAPLPPPDSSGQG